MFSTETFLIDNVDHYADLNIFLVYAQIKSYLSTNSEYIFPVIFGLAIFFFFNEKLMLRTSGNFFTSSLKSFVKSVVLCLSIIVLYVATVFFSYYFTDFFTFNLPHQQFVFGLTFFGGVIGCLLLKALLLRFNILGRTKEGNTVYKGWARFLTLLK